MITLSKNGDAIRFTFADSQHYLTGNGTIDVPVNSLSLVFDSSDFATFKKAASNDIFVSAPLAEFGMSKADLISFYTSNMVSTGGGGGTGSGITSGEVQSMIDESISGKVDTTTFATYSAATEQTLSGKQDTLVYYSEDTDAKSAQIHIEDNDEGTVAQLIINGNGGVDLYNETAEGVGTYVGAISEEAYMSAQDGEGNSTYLSVTTEGAFIDGNEIVTEDVLSDYALASDLEDVEQAVAQSINVLAQSVSGKADTSAVNTLINQAVSGKASTDYVDAAVSGKQDTLIAGSGITISGNVISADGGSGGMTEDDELLLATALVDLNDRKMDTADAKAEFAKYQKKGDYITSGQLDTKLAAYETALDEQNVEEVTSYALNDLNERLTTVETALGGLSLSAITQSQWATISGSANPSTIYIITNNE